MPESLDRLVPTYWAELALDPFAGRPFLYRLSEGDAFVLYSTGPKRTDAGRTFGQSPCIQLANADLCLDF